MLAVTEVGFSAAARRIACADLPTAVTQEGGYLCEAPTRNLVAFLDGFKPSI
ncbi:hypothetical protein [Methylobacterium sp. WL9]|uniref:hypothetical protein n=1 Tax=Methylobacterium sp. WL9 TaxID=2603898 RepID=UPI00164FA444|nr:hypothetical protein [Methylobacterium sp. WL9]